MTEEEQMTDPRGEYVDNMLDDPEDAWPVEGGFTLCWSDWLGILLLVGVAIAFLLEHL